MKILKILGMAFATLLVLLALGFAALLWIVDLNDYKKQIENVAAEKGVLLKIEGDLGWTLFPAFGISSGKLTATLPASPSTQAGAAPTPVAFERLNLSVQLLPLLNGEVLVNTIRVEGGSLSLAGATPDESTRITQLDLHAQNLNLQQNAFPLALSLQMETFQKEKIVQHIELDSQLQLSLEKTLQQVVINSSHHNIRFRGDAIQQRTADIKADFAADIDLPQSTADLKDFQLQIDDSALKGTISVNFGQQPYYRVNLQGQRLDLDRYLAPDNKETASKAAPQQTDDAAAANNPIIPVAALLAFPGEYQLAFDALRSNHLDLADVKVDISVSRDGLLTMKPISLKLYEGQFTLNGTVNAAPALPQVKLTLDLTPLQLEPALKAYLQQDKSFASGDFAFDARIETRGLTLPQLMGNLDGQFHFSSTTISLNGVDLTSSLDAGLLQMLQVKLPALMAAENKTVMSDLVGEGKIQQGLVSPLFTAKALCTTFAGNGRYGLLDKMLDYQVGITFPSADSNSACADINPRLKDTAWPLRCKGSLEGDAAKLCSVDSEKVQALLAKAAKKEAGDKIDKKLDEALKKKFGEDAEGVKQFLKGLTR